MSKLRVCTLVLTVVLHASWAGAQDPQAVPAARFAGTWVGTQAWAIPDPPPGARNDQPVTLTLEVVDGRITGSMKPFLGGEDGATLVDATIVGDELRATAVVGAASAGGRGRGWKEPIRIAFSFRNVGVDLTGGADVHMGDVPWMAFKYELSRKRSRY